MESCSFGLGFSIDTILNHITAWCSISCSAHHTLPSLYNFLYSSPLIITYYTGMIQPNLPYLFHIHGQQHVFSNSVYLFGSLCQSPGYVPLSDPADQGETQGGVWVCEGENCDDSALFSHRGGPAGWAVRRTAELLCPQEYQGMKRTWNSQSYLFLLSRNPPSENTSCFV